MAKVTIINKRAFFHYGFTLEDVSALEDLADSGGRYADYWQSAHDFVIGLAERDVEELSAKQVNWAIQIKDKLDELRRKGKI